jgi:uncharacterized membrane protein YdjX (TVP38/TMEM64 family)
VIVRWLDGFGGLDAGAAGALAATCILAAFVPVPRTILVLGAGAVFGLKSLLVIVPSMTFGCILAFLLARGLLRNWVDQSDWQAAVVAGHCASHRRRILLVP